MADRVIVLTGATEGIGKAAALALAKPGVTLLIVGRNAEKTAGVADALRAKGGRVEVVLGDLSVLAEVRRIAAEILQKTPAIDVLVNNAGALFMDHQLTADGLEQTFALDHLAPFLLTKLLIDAIVPGGRVITTSSGAHEAGRMDLATVARRPNGQAGFPAYGDAKLANVLFTRALARRVGADRMTVTCFHPGWVWTGFGLNNAGWLSSALKVVGPWLARTPERGADTLVWLATTPDTTGQHGGYFQDRTLRTPSKRAQDEALADGLWSLSEQLCG